MNRRRNYDRVTQRSIFAFCAAELSRCTPCGEDCMQLRTVLEQLHGKITDELLQGIDAEMNSF
jgi:hypothetical protein